MSEPKEVRLNDKTPFWNGLGWCLIWLGLGGCVYLATNNNDKPLIHIELEKGKSK